MRSWHQVALRIRCLLRTSYHQALLYWTTGLLQMEWQKTYRSLRQLPFRVIKLSSLTLWVTYSRSKALYGLSLACFETQGRHFQLIGKWGLQRGNLMISSQNQGIQIWIRIKQHLRRDREQWNRMTSVNQPRNFSNWVKKHQIISLITNLSRSKGALLQWRMCELGLLVSDQK